MTVPAAPAGNSIDFFVIFVNVMRRLPRILFAVLALSSCATSVPDFSQLGTPEFVAVTAASASEDEATHIATVTGSTQVSTCGFVLSPSGGGEKTEYSAQRDGDIFTCSLRGLQPSSTYEFTAFVVNGAGMRLDSPVRSFTTLERQEPAQPEGPDYPGQPENPDDPEGPDTPEDLRANDLASTRKYCFSLLWRFLTFIPTVKPW